MNLMKDKLVTCATRFANKQINPMYFPLMSFQRFSGSEEQLTPAARKMTFFQNVFGNVAYPFVKSQLAFTSVFPFAISADMKSFL